MRTIRLSIIVGAAVICCAFGFCSADSLTVATDLVKVTTPEQARQIALAYTGFDSTAKIDIVFKKFRLAVMPMADSAGNEIIKESNLWLVTFYQVDVITPTVYRDFKVFIDPRSGLLVELYSIPIDSIPRPDDGTTDADENFVADMTRFVSEPPPGVSFVRALSMTYFVNAISSRQVFAICECDQYQHIVEWSIWGTGILPEFSHGPRAGKETTMQDQIDATTLKWNSGGNAPAPYEQWK